MTEPTSTAARPPAGRSAPPLLTAGQALFLDFDGTLVALAEHPDCVIVPPSLRPLLHELAASLGGALAIVTGRRLESLDAQLAPLRLRGAGMHGAQLRADVALPPVMAPSLGDIAERLRHRFDGDAEVWIEDKGAAVAVHYRKAPQRSDQVRTAVNQLAARDRQEIEVIAGNCVFEARKRGHGKDAAIRSLMVQAPFRDRSPVFIGDDVTDEDGIREVQSVADGIGIKVGGGETVALYRLPTPVDVLDWLECSLRSLSSDRPDGV